MPEGTLREMLREKILRLRAGEEVPPGYELKRVVGMHQIPALAGVKIVYVVAVRDTRPERDA